MSWIMSLADKQSPDWLGLPNNAETVLLTNLGKSVIVKLLKMQQLDEDEELAYDQVNYLHKFGFHEKKKKLILSFDITKKFCFLFTGSY